MLAFLTRQFRALSAIARPPFDGLWLAILLYFFWCFLVYPKSQVLRGNLPDPDDYMYLNQVLDWLKGQSWFDPFQHRLSPPEGGHIHFSRLAQIPIAAMTGLFMLIGFPPVGAATLTALILPIVLFAGFFFAIRWVAESFVPKNWAGASAYVAFFATGLLAMFAPGHIDHHGQIVIFVTVALGCAVRMMLNPARLVWAAGAGFMMALSLTVALEVLPWLMVMSGWIGLWAVIKGRAAVRGGLAFGLTLFIASALLLFTARRPSELFVIDMGAYSIVYVLFTGSIATVFAAVALAANLASGWRWALGLSATAAAAGLFFSRFPDLMTGPWGGVNPALATLILDNVNEAKPFYLLKGGSWFRTLTSMLEPLTALGASLYFLHRARGNTRWCWGLITVLLAAALTLAVFHQYRFVGMLGVFVIVPLTAFLFTGWQWIRKHVRERSRLLAKIGLLLVVGPLPAVLAPALFDGRSFNKGVFLFPVHNNHSSVCDMVGLEKVLWAPQIYGGKARVIMNTMGLGPELMFRTPHMVLSAPYHEVVNSNLDAVRFFSTTDPARAEAIARQWRAELVVACKLIPGMYTDLAAVREALPDMMVSHDTKTGGEAQPPMILRIITGQELPGWLVPVTSSVLSNFVVYKIAPPPSREQKSPASE